MKMLRGLTCIPHTLSTMRGCHGILILLLLDLVCGVLQDTADKHVPYQTLRSPAQSHLVLDTKMGQIRGTVINSEEMMTTRFLGIPYASPPVGDLRFHPPLKHPGWAMEGVLNATEYGPSCPQDVSKWVGMMEPEVYKDRVQNTDINEDCLFLNIFIPGNLSEVEHINTRQVPVMVYIHGGGFDSESAMLYGGWRLAHRGNVIVASMNYRLGVLGFFSLQSDAAKGNWGLLDQRLALMWLWDNIREFGGNPEQITLFGESAGAVSVGYHVLSPLSRGFFSRAIGQSGSALQPCCLQRDPVKVATSLIEKLQCPNGPDDAIMRCLRNMPIWKLVEASREIAKTDHIGAWKPVIDGHFLPGDPLKLMQAGRFNPVDYIIGINTHEMWTAQGIIPVDLKSGITLQEFETLVASYVSQYYKQNVENIIAAVMLEYNFCSREKIEIAESYVDFLTESEYISPAHLAANLIARTRQRKVYFYEFSHKPSFAGSDRPYYVVADHKEEVNFVFGFVFYLMNSVTRKERDLSAALMDAWANFAWFGDPNPILADGGVTWPEFTESSRSYLEWNTQLDGSMAKNHYRPGRMAFWNDYLPQIASRNTCVPSKDYCDRHTRAVEQRYVKTSTALWALVVLCAVLFVIVLLLCIKVCVPAKTWKQCCKAKQKHANNINYEQEQKKLQPLPYYEEPEAT